MEYFILGTIVIAIIAVLAFIATVQMLKNKKGNITFFTSFTEYFKFNLSANWENDNQTVHKNKNKKS